MVAQLRGHSASCASKSAVGSAVPYSLAWYVAEGKKCKEVVVETSVMRNLFFPTEIGGDYWMAEFQTNCTSKQRLVLAFTLLLSHPFPNLGSMVRS